MTTSIIDASVRNRKQASAGLWDLRGRYLLGASPFLDQIADDLASSPEAAEEVHAYATGDDEAAPDHFEFCLDVHTSTPAWLRFRAVSGPIASCEYVEFVARRTSRGWRIGATRNAPENLPDHLL